METQSPASLFSRVREVRPLVHHITNYVTVNDCANVTLAAGAAPVMADAPEEVAEMAGTADALVLNIGTLSSAQVEAMLLAGKAANARGIPIVLDPVGAGATRFRTTTDSPSSRTASDRRSQGKRRRDRDDRRNRGQSARRGFGRVDGRSGRGLQPTGGTPWVRRVHERADRRRS